MNGNFAYIKRLRMSQSRVFVVVCNGRQASMGPLGRNPARRGCPAVLEYANRIHLHTRCHLVDISRRAFTRTEFTLVGLSRSIWCLVMWYAFILHLQRT